MRVGRGRSTAQQLHKRVVFHCLYVRNGNGGAAAVLNGQLEELEQECRCLSVYSTVNMIAWEGRDTGGSGMDGWERGGWSSCGNVERARRCRVDVDRAICFLVMLRPRCMLDAP